MRVILADAPAIGTRLDASYSNLGLLYLAGSLNAAFAKAELDVTYLPAKQDIKGHVEFVRRYRPDIYGISFTSKAARRSYEAIRAVREACPGVRIVAGGAHPSALPEDVFAQSPVDIVVPGEGELTFTELIKAFSASAKPDLGSVSGLLFRHEGQVVRTACRPLVADLDDIPFPAWELVDFHDYPGMHLKKQPLETSMLVSRGCPFHCTFCSQPVWKYHKPWLRARSVQNICAEIELLYHRGIREIYLTSDEVNFNEPWAVELCHSIADLNHPDLYFQCNLRSDKVTARLAEALAAMRCWLVHLGIESANDRVLEGIGKKITVAQIDNATRLLSDAGVKVFAFMMLYQVWEDNGRLCWESTEEVENSLRFVRRLFRERRIQYMSWQFCTPMPGAILYELARRHNLYRGNPESVWETFDEHTVAMNVPGVSEKDMRRKLKKGILLKDWYMIRSGQISLRHVWRAWENLRALLK